MKYSKGNQKLGTNCLVISRAVGPSCPTSCYFLGNGCYAEATEKVYKSARKVGEQNMKTEVDGIRSIILLAATKQLSIRFHERGDWGDNDEIDLEYVSNVKKACEQLVKSGIKLPEMWCYTHFYSPLLIKELGQYVRMYASVHNQKDIRLAKRAGFKLFAYIDTDNRFVPDKPRGKLLENVPRRVTFDKIDFLVCPEQRVGRDRVTCTGDKNSTACNWCVKNRENTNVLFINH